MLEVARITTERTYHKWELIYSAGDKSQRLERAENLIEDISLHSAERRMTRETLSRKLSAFEEEGLIRQVGHRRIVVLNRERLENLGMD